MIWTGGRLMDANEFFLPGGDRTCEHGLGLFETFRTWDGQAPLLASHLDRLRQSAMNLAIPIDEGTLPDDAAVRMLVEADGRRDAVVRLTVSGGSANASSVAWMLTRPLPPDRNMSDNPGGISVHDNPWAVAIGDPLARHKTLNYWSRRLAHEQALAAGVDEAILGSDDGLLWEGSRANLILVVDRTLITPPTSGPIVPGIMRRVVLDVGRQSDFAVEERPVDGALVEAADEVLLCNSVRGLLGVRRWVGRFDRPRDTLFTQTSRLRRMVAQALNIPGPSL